MSSEHGNLKVLVVDDQQDLLGVLKELLVAEGFDVTTVATGELAIDQLRANKFHLMISDIGLPGIDGWQVVAATKQYAAEMPIILISSWKDEITEERQKKYSVASVIHKPFRVAELFEEIERLNLYHKTIPHQSLKIG
ncbi:MAG: response regulator [Candidatus Zixiibacteriota bacterium]